MFSKINEIMLYDAYAHVMMYGNVMFLVGENKSRIAVGEKRLNSSFPLGIVNEDNCENKPVGQDNSAGE